MRQLARRSLLILTLLVLWESAVRSQVVSGSLFPAPTVVLSALFDMLFKGDLLLAAAKSSLRAVCGFVLGALAGVFAGVVTGRASWGRDYFYPVIQMLRPLPPVAIIPLVLVWFGIGELYKILSISFAVFFPVWLNTHVGAQSIPEAYLWSAQTLKVKGFSALIRIVLPGSLPLILAGMRAGVAVAFIMVFVSELAGASAGLGYEISANQLAYRMDRMVAALAMLALLGAGADFLLNQWFKAMFPWMKLSGLR